MTTLGARWRTRDTSLADSRARLVGAGSVRLNVPFLLNALAIAGALVAAGQVIEWSLMGAWPYHDTVNYWLAGRHVLEGGRVYDQPSGFLQFIYAPPAALVWAAVAAIVPVYVATAFLLGLQILALRFVCGSWRNAGLVAWLPIVPRELASGNVDLIVAATIYAALTGVRRSGWLVALMMFTKWSPATVLVGCSRERWREAVIAGVVLVAMTLPWIALWPPYIGLVLGGVGPGEVIIPLIIRVPICVALFALRRPWATAAGAALITPAFYFHSLVLLLPAGRLYVTKRQVGLPTGSTIVVASRAPETLPKVEKGLVGTGSAVVGDPA